VYPASQWNYAIAASPENAAEKVSTHESDIGGKPFAAKPTPVELHVTARKLPTWRAEDGAADPVPASPVLTDEPDETIRLIPLRRRETSDHRVSEASELNFL
jgi:uncharacterized protein